MKTNNIIDLTNFNQNDLLAKLFCLQRSKLDWYELTTSEIISFCNDFAKNNFVINSKYTVDIISSNLALFLFGSEKSGFNKLLSD